MTSLSFSSQIGVFLFFPLLAAAILTVLSVWISGRYATKNAKAQNEIAEKNAKAQNDLAVKLKLADFRQAWINDLRNSLSELEARGLSNTYAQDEVLELTRLTQKVRMLMNKDDPHYPELSNLLALLNMNANTEARQKYVRDLTPLAQKILKDEWEVLKRDLNYKSPASTPHP